VLSNANERNNRRNQHSCCHRWSEKSMMTVLLLLCVALCWADVEAVAMPTQFVTCKTTASDDMFVIELKPEWAPRGVRIKKQKKKKTTKFY
jgi:hypothetical protein